MQEVKRSCGKPVEPFAFTFKTDNVYVDDDGNAHPHSVIWDMRTACHADSPALASENAEIPRGPSKMTNSDEERDHPDIAHQAVASGGVVGLCPHELSLLQTGRVNKTMDVAVSPRWHFTVTPAQAAPAPEPAN